MSTDLRLNKLADRTVTATPPHPAYPVEEVGVDALGQGVPRLGSLQHERKLRYKNLIKL